jgi:hypothetical protein
MKKGWPQRVALFSWPLRRFPIVMPALCRASTPFERSAATKDVDGWDKPGHDGEGVFGSLYALRGNDGA